MFVYSFLVMTAYNNIKPSATSKFISDLGADNLPWVMLLAGLTIGVIMQSYSRLVGMIPRNWVLPGTQVVVVGFLIGFWFLFQTSQEWVSAAFYFWGRLLLGIFLISQFWTLANDIYDPRQAKRVFGFIGGGTSLGGMTGAGLTSLLAKRVGTDNLLLFSAGIVTLCFFIVLMIQRRVKAPDTSALARSHSTRSGEALSMLRQSKHLRLIALVVGFAALGAVTIEQQLNMAAEAEVQTEDAITSFLASITFYISAIGFFIQVFLVSRIYRLVGIGFALMVLPVSLGATALLILLNPVLWAPSVARVADSATRYSLDKTTREVLFLPLPGELKLRAKSFVDVVGDRFIGKGIGSILLLLVIKVLGFTWYQVSFLSLGYCLIWIYMARKARKEYVASFRKSIETEDLAPVEMKLETGDPSTIETLIEELGSPDERRVLYAIDLLDSLEKQNLITPLLLHHRSSNVRERALKAIQTVRPDLVKRWTPAIEKALTDESPGVRAAAVTALADLRKEQAADLMRPYLGDDDPRMAAAAAVALARSAEESDQWAAETTLQRLATDMREAAVPARREVARAVSQMPDPRFRHLLVSLLYDPNLEVAKEAIASARELGTSDHIFVPTLVSLLRHRHLKFNARQVLVSYGEDVLDALGYFMRDVQEDVWVRRHVPGTIALIPCQNSMDILLETLKDEDGLLRFKTLNALERLHRGYPELPVAPEPILELADKEALRYYRYLSLHYNLFDKGDLPKDSLLAQAFHEKLERVWDRLFRTTALIWPWRDVLASRWAIEKGDARARSSAVEYLDNMMSGTFRKRFMSILEEMPIDEKVRRGNVTIKTRVRSVEETLERLIYDDDPVIAALAIDTVRERKIWSLVDDVEQALKFRDAKDFIVFEAASLALGEHRLGKELRHAV